MTDDQPPHDWQLLSCICNSLGRPDHPLYRALAHADYPKEYRLLALESALRPRKVPLRGCRVTAFGLAPSERIETKIDVETVIDIPLDEVTLRNRYDSPANLGPHERPTKVIESTAPEWMPSDETRASMISRNGPPRFPAVDVIELAVFQRVEADRTGVIAWFNENVLPHGKQPAPLVNVADKPVQATDAELAQTPSAVEAPKQIPRMQAAILKLADKLWPDGNVPVRIGKRDDAIIKEWKEKPPPHPRTIKRAFKSRTKMDKI
jgi:hypothetical protein